jgi:hypothetical protein
MYAAASPNDTTASNAAITRLRTTSGVRRCMMPVSATIVRPSLVPMASRETSTRANAGANPTPNAAIAMPNDASTSHNGSVAGFRKRPNHEPSTDPVPQQAINAANPTDPTPKRSARAASATMPIPIPNTKTNHAKVIRRITRSRHRNASPALNPLCSSCASRSRCC